MGKPEILIGQIKWFAPFCMGSFRKYWLWFVFLCKGFPPRSYGKLPRYFPGKVFFLLFCFALFLLLTFLSQCLWWGLCSCSNHWQCNTVHQAYGDVIIMSWLVCRVKPITGPLKSDDGNVNENIKKAMGVTSKSATLHNLWLSLCDCNVKMPYFTSYGEHKQMTTKFFFLNLCVHGS